jgi:hypothetical protein
MKRTILVLLATALIYGSCTKDHSVVPAKNHTFRISFKTALDAIADTTWQQVFGGQGIIQFTTINSDTSNVSSIKDSLDLKNIGSYSKQLVANTYDISLVHQSTAIVDTFIRFSAQAKGVLIAQDQVVSLDATATDGVITINKDIVNPSIVPTFTPAGSNTAYNFALANGRYYIYVQGAASGRVNFTAAATGDLYLEDITVDAMNQYDLSAILNTASVTVRTHLFHLPTNLK